MITGTILKNGSIKLILTGIDDIDTAVLKALGSGHCKVIAENYRLGDKSITGGLMIEQVQEEQLKANIQKFASAADLNSTRS